MEEQGHDDGAAVAAAEAAQRRRRLRHHRPRSKRLGDDEAEGNDGGDAKPRTAAAAVRDEAMPPQQPQQQLAGSKRARASQRDERDAKASDAASRLRRVEPARGGGDDEDDDEAAVGAAMAAAAAAARRRKDDADAQTTTTTATAANAANAVPVVTDYRQLQLNPHIVSTLQSEFGFDKLTDIQARCIPAALQGRDLLAEAKTGSGKTLAFLVPTVELITRAGFRASNGTAAVIIGPTRELCLQIDGVLTRLLKHFHGAVTYLCCIGGQSRNQEGYKLAAGVMIVIASPGRLLDHLKLTKDWHTQNLLLLAVDEADRVLDNGFEEDMREIVALLPKKRQTLLFSATQTTRVEQLARVSFRRPPLFISMRSHRDKATVDTLEQGYVVCPSERRLLVLYHFVKRNAQKKMIVFFSSRNSVSFHCELFNYIDVPCVAFHGKQKQHQRSATYMQFCNAERGVLFTTDVAARGLDIPAVDWIVQYDPPDEATKYVHRVGRTARAGRCGNALLFLLPQEKLFLKYLYADAHVTVNEYTFDASKLNAQVQAQLEQLVGANYYLRQSAKQAYEGYLLSYSSSQLKNVYDVQQLDLAAVAKGFALSEPPPLRIDLSQSAAHLSKKARREHHTMRSARDGARRAVNDATLQRRHKNISGEWGPSSS